MKNDIIKIKEYIDTRAILSKPEKDYLKKVVDKENRYEENYELLKARIIGRTAALITERLLAIEDKE